MEFSKSKFLNLGSLNIDRVYNVPHFAVEGETLSSLGYREYCGGKGLNQSIASARAGAAVFHCGAIGEGGEVLTSLLVENGVDVRHLRQFEGPGGHAVIQVTPQGRNAIIVHPGSNRKLTDGHVDEVLKKFSSGDLLLVQNETNCVAHAIEAAKRRGMTVAVNPSPVTDELLAFPLELADFLILNEIEGRALIGRDVSDYREMPPLLRRRFPGAAIVLTLGDRGVLYEDARTEAVFGAYDVPVADTTAAGDTFCGYFLAEMIQSRDTRKALQRASAAAALAVSRDGASSSIPTAAEVANFLAARPAPECLIGKKA